MRPAEAVRQDVIKRKKPEHRNQTEVSRRWTISIVSFLCVRANLEHLLIMPGLTRQPFVSKSKRV